MKNKVRIAIIYNTSWGIYNFRKKLISSLQELGYEIFTIAPEDEYSSILRTLGCKHFSVNLNSKSKNPFVDFKFCFQLRKILKKINPHLILNFTAKPNIYGTLVSSNLNISSINNIAGLGLGFTENTIISKILVKLYYISQRKASHVFFQNPIDQALFAEKNIVNQGQYSLLPGSGVDLDRFPHTQNEFDPQKPISFLLIARMLYSKGILIFIEAAKHLYLEGARGFEIRLLGDFGVNSSDAIPPEEIQKWEKESYVKYLGRTDNVLPFIQSCNCVVLPSFYREGTPRSLLEALSVGRPIITTTMPGCKDTVKDGWNGFYVNPKDVQHLKEKLREFLNLSLDVKIEFGENSRKLAEKKFNESFVISKYIKEIERAI